MIAPCVCGYVEGVDDAVPAGEIVPRRGGQCQYDVRQIGGRLGGLGDSVDVYLEGEA
jgi:hypothetical protein